MILTAVLALAVAASAQPAASDMPAGTAPGAPGGWQKKPSSLVLIGADGDVLDEAGLGEFRESAAGGMVLKTTMLGGASADGRFAWKWRKRETLRAGRDDRSIGSTVSLSYLGAQGQPLWESDSADAPAGVDPLAQSADGETVLLVQRSPAGWKIAAMKSSGARVVELPPVQRLERVQLTANGRYALVLAGPRDGALVYTLLDLKKGARKELAAASVPLGIDSLSEDGAASSRKKPVYKFP
ncbi:MAG TPA: hypothetical protein VNI01_12180 [Elusimicrobiota bacterium]|nr:hypothetical protein [Elusimicrobiota bacterium]